MSSFFKVVLVLSAFIIIYWTLSYKSAPIIEDAVVENPDVVQILQAEAETYEQIRQEMKL